MNRRLGLGLAVVGVLVSTWCGSARAGLVTWEFEGVVTSVRDDNGVVTGLVEVGSSFSGSFTFDVDTPDSSPKNSFGSYEDAVVELSGAISALQFAGVGEFDWIRVFNDGLVSDSFVLDAIEVSTPLLSQPSDIYLQLTDTSGTTFSDDSLR